MDSSTRWAPGGEPAGCGACCGGMRKRIVSSTLRLVVVEEVKRLQFMDKSGIFGLRFCCPSWGREEAPLMKGLRFSVCNTQFVKTLR